ncbi:hypothetical protein BD626DRAFT_515420 [Schizophyllum amplum]|uniref:MYND-type domain-containing protein n=1 Tax=Schizophyllum amplum TaxID=97359 RepID=A0A550BXT3_9AGAR|nr:hypothetical protein BD626DRAFT_515420 [Auriculariopsis ampla]
MHALWPNIVKWSAVLHPARGRLQRTSAQRSIGHDVTGIAQTYLTIMGSDASLIKPFLHAHPDAVLQVLELWLHFPRYLPAAALETCGCAYAIGVTALAMYDVLVYPANRPTPQDRALFVNQLCIAVGSKKTLYRAAVEQTDFLTTLRIPPLRPMAWDNHFGFIGFVVDVPELEGQNIPGKLIRSVVSAARHCLNSRETQYSAALGLKLLATLCMKAKDNRPLVHAFKAGVFDLLRDAESARLDFDLSELVRLLCAGLLQIKVIRAFHRRHPGEIAVSHLGTQELTRQVFTWTDVAHTWNSSRQRYLGSHRRREWRQTDHCANAQGPHNRLVRVCPCASIFYCSGSCQRLHWAAVHWESCMATQGAWAMRGAISLADAMFVQDLVRSYIADRHATIAAQISAQMSRKRGLLADATNLSIHVDFSDAVLTPRHEIRVRYPYGINLPLGLKYPIPGIVLVEVSLRLGTTLRECYVPLAFHVKDFVG